MCCKDSMQNGLNTLTFYSNDVLVFHIFSITYYALTGLFKQGERKLYKSNNNLCSFVKKRGKNQLGGCQTSGSHLRDPVTSSLVFRYEIVFY